MTSVTARKCLNQKEKRKAKMPLANAFGGPCPYDRFFFNLIRLGREHNRPAEAPSLART